MSLGIRVPSKVFKELQWWRLVQQSDVVVSVPKLITHDQTEITCDMKNFKGLQTNNGKREDDLERLFGAVVGLMSVVKPQSPIIDVTVGKCMPKRARLNGM